MILFFFFSFFLFLYKKMQNSKFEKGKNKKLGALFFFPRGFFSFECIVAFIETKLSRRAEFLQG